MCGIAGFLTAARDTTEQMQAVVLSMASTLRHRGPDDSGTWVDQTAGVALGHRRLSVVDLSPLGHQPMHSATGRYIIVFNGEIYNFRALRNELEKRGRAFRGHSDTEVMLAAITEWGVDEAVVRFNGMFAFAVWDRQETQLHLVRDRFGEKPLYYGSFGETFVFGSELKALRAHPRFKGDIDRDALGLFMRYGYVPTPRCIYRDVRKLPPGAVLSLRANTPGAEPQPFVYWSAAEVALGAVAAPFAGSDEDATEQFERLLDDAVKLRLEADVPLGAFLSGGVDSSTIVALMQRHVAGQVKTFTVGFDEAPYNEAEDAKRVAHHLGTQHTELYVSPAEAMAVIPRLPTLYDEPFADSSQIPTFLISALARRHVTVSLSGDGGDELLAGYNRYLVTAGLSRRLVRSPLSVRALIARGLRTLAPGTWDRVFAGLKRVAPSLGGQRHIGDKLHRLAGVLANGQPDDVYTSVMSIWDRPSHVVLGTSDHRDAGIASPPDAKHLDDTQLMMLQDALTYLPDDILVKVDRASMGVSLETRVPFLDHRVAEFCWSLPMSLKVRDGQRKWLLRQVLRRYLPDGLFDRPKTGFAVPIAAWLRTPMRSWAADLLDAGRLRAQGYLNPDEVTVAWARHLSGQANYQDRLWCALMFETWLDEQRQYSTAQA